MAIEKKNLLRVFVILLAGVLISALLILLHPKPQPLPPEPEDPHPAEVVKVVLVDDVITIKTQGTVQAKINIDVTAQVAGQVVEVSDNFAVGAAFEKGEVLLQIDQRDYEILLAQAASRLAEARKQLATEQGQARQAQREWKDLGNAQANDLFLRKPQIAAAEAAVEAAQAEVRQAQINLERTSVSLPFAGRVARTDVNLGQFIGAGSTVANVFSMAVMEVRLPLTALQVHLLNLQLDADHFEPLPVALSMSVGSNHLSWQGEVVRGEPQADTTSRLFYVVAEVRQPSRYSELNPSLLPGTFVEAAITSAPYQGIALLPRDALYQRDKVMVLDLDNHLRVTPIEVLQVSDATLAVKGLNEGDLVLVKPPAFVELGVEYSPVFASDETGITTASGEASSQ